MEPVAVTASTAAAKTASKSATSAAAAKKTEKQSFDTLFADAKKKLESGEKLQKVSGHSYAEIKGGTRNGEFVNLSGNGRSGQAFHLVERNGHTFHVYGTGKNKVIVEVDSTDKSASAGGTQATG